MDQLGVFYKIVKEQPLVSASYPTPLFTVDRSVCDDASTEPVHFPTMVPSIPLPTAYFTYSISSQVNAAHNAYVSIDFSLGMINIA